MTKLRRTIIVPAATLAESRALAATIPECEGMFTLPLTTDGVTRLPPATHYASSGFVPEELLPLFSGPEYIVADLDIQTCQDTLDANGLYRVEEE